MNKLLHEAVKYIVNPINLIDVGCHKAHFLDEIMGYFKINYSLGIDPCNHMVDYRYNKYYNVAIINDEPCKMKFNEYLEPGCNSLLTMKTDRVVHDRRQDGWYVGWTIEKLIKIIDVDAKPLSDLIDETPQILPIHFLKIDAQGLDIAVVKSLNQYLHNVHLIQIEAVSSHDVNNTLYAGQSIMEQDIEIMQTLGFSVVMIEDYADNASPECNILFKNIRIYEN